jgi:glutathione S-transferase
MKLIIGNKNYSSWSLRPWLLLSFYKVEFDEIRLPLFIDNFEEKLKTHTGAGFVPVLEDGDLTVWDSLAICEYISEKYLSDTGWPSDPSARAEARSCSSEMHSGFFNIRNNMPMNVRAINRHIEITPEIKKEIDRINSLWNDLRKKYSKNGPWLFGEFSIADCMFSPISFRFNTYGVELTGMAKDYMHFVLRNPHIENWLQDSKNENETIDRSEVGI